MLTLDHIAISAERLAPAVPVVEAELGQSLLPGGEHAAMGTHNRLLSLGPDEYFELIAIDPDAPGPDQPRWFDLDNFSGPPRATTWICRCPDIEAAVAAAPEGIGVPWSLERNDLRWKMAVPKDGKLPFDCLFPALIEWTGPIHPAPRLHDSGVRLSALRLISPQAGALRDALAKMIDDPRVQVLPGDTPRVEAILSTAKGEVVL